MRRVGLFVLWMGIGVGLVRVGWWAGRVERINRARALAAAVRGADCCSTHRAVQSGAEWLAAELARNGRRP